VRSAEPPVTRGEAEAGMVIEPGSPLVESDFGHLLRGRAIGVCRPRSVAELVSIVAIAIRDNLALTVRGGGLSQGGQCLPDDSVVVDMSSWNEVGAVDRGRRTVRCEPGATWRAVLAETLREGLVPKVHPLNLDVTVGGTLSAGGVGSTSHRHGFAASHVYSAQVVLGTGELVTTGPYLNRHVFDAVFGGAGRVGVLASVELNLEIASERVRTWTLRYHDSSSLLAALSLASQRPWVDHLGAMCCATTYGSQKTSTGRRQPIRRWSFAMEVTRREGSESPPLDLTTGEVLHEEVDDLPLFLARYDGRFEMMHATGAWHEPHPWFEAFVPLAAADRILELIMRLPAFFGDGHRAAVIADSDRPLALAFPEPGPALVVAVLPMSVPSGLLPVAFKVIAELNTAVQSVGGCRYVSGWLSGRDSFDWTRQYGSRYERVAALERTLDPGRLFRSKLARIER
jgi:cytokinin dehydrogenase